MKLKIVLLLEEFKKLSTEDKSIFLEEIQLLHPEYRRKKLKTERENRFNELNERNPDSVLKVEIFNKNGVCDFSLIDCEDSDLKEFRYNLHNDYAMRTGYSGNTRKNLRLHMIIMDRFEKPDKFKSMIDHINGDSLDNRRTNLRRVTPSGNMGNYGTPRHNASGLMNFRKTKNNEFKYRKTISGITIEVISKFPDKFIESLKEKKNYFKLKIDIDKVILWIESNL